MELIINCSNNLAYSPDISYFVMIWDKCGQVQFATHTKSETVHVCCCGKSFVVAVSLYRNGSKLQEITRYINCAKENRLPMNFDFFSEDIPAYAMQQFMLVDKTYRIPIKSAELLFSQALKRA